MRYSIKIPKSAKGVKLSIELPPDFFEREMNGSDYLQFVDYVTLCIVNEIRLLEKAYEKEKANSSQAFEKTVQ